MLNELGIRIAGAAGQGMQTMGIALCRILKKAGFSIFANQDYMSRIRGGNNFFQLRISDSPLYSLREQIDICVALDRASVDIHEKDLTPGGIIVLDRNKFDIAVEDSSFFDVPVYDLATRVGGSEIFISSVCIGVLAGLIGVEFNFVEEILKVTFADKKENIIKKNIEVAGEGYNFTEKHFRQDRFRIIAGKVRESLLMNGNEAIALGAIAAGCKFYSAYPMTPSTSIMNTVAEYGKKFNIVIEQAEDEIAAVNMIIGASFAGARSMAGTSGGGFALMVEGLSLAGMTETPIVIIDAQRPAPATGFPTRTEQSDLDFLIHAGHGEFARAVYTPGTAEEAFYLTIKAFNTAEKFQVPALIMTDQYLADSYRDIDVFDSHKVKIQRYIISREDSKDVAGYQRYRFTDSGISPRAVPSWIDDVIYADSDEHTEGGHITEDAEVRQKMVEKRFHKKMSGLSGEIEEPTACNLEGADITLIGYGSTYGVLREVSEAAVERKTGFIHLSQVWPFPAEKLVSLLRQTKKIFTVENNAGAQLAKLIKREAGIEVDQSILRFDGRPFNFDFLVRTLRNVEG